MFLSTRSIPPVSLGLPVYNGERYLANALTGLLSQDFEDFELILSDNASTDGTEEICRQFAASDQRIRYYRNSTNIGLGGNHNRTFDLSRGKFFKWVAYDDEFPRAMLARFVSVLEAQPPSVNLVCSVCEYIDENGNVIGQDGDGLDRGGASPCRRLWYLLRHVHAYNTIYGLIRSNVLRRTRLHGQYPLADRVLIAELAMLGQFVELPEVLLRIRQHKGRTFLANTSAAARREVFTPGRVSPSDHFLSIKKRAELELIRSATVIPARLRDKISCTAVALTKPQIETFRTFVGRHRRRIFRSSSFALGPVTAKKDI